jgi:molybdopterin-guanine dinucleotide biosynthesis protein A
MIPNVTGVILAGGASSRMGSDKALLSYQGQRLVEVVFTRIKGLFDEVILVANDSERYNFLPCRKVNDKLAYTGALVGVHAGLFHSQTPYSFVVACDMPLLNPALIERLADYLDCVEIVIPESDAGYEPLHAFYSKTLLNPIEKFLQSGQKRISAFIRERRVKIIPKLESAQFSSDLRFYRNINTPEDYRALCDACEGFATEIFS